MGSCEKSNFYIGDEDDENFVSLEITNLQYAS